MTQPNLENKSHILVLWPFWIGLITGLAEVTLLGVKKFVLYKIIQFGPHVMWMSPVANACIFVLVGIFLFCISSRWSKFANFQVASTTFFLFAFLALLSHYHPLHVLARFILAAGLAVQVGRLVGSYPLKVMAFVRGTTGLMVVLVLATGITVQSWQVFGERRQIEALPHAHSTAPNVLFITLDTVRARNLSLYGYSKPTSPNIEQIGHGGAVFEQAISPSPWTLPAHASMFTGQWPHQLTANWTTPLDGTYSTIAEVLQDHGYATAGFVANTFYCSYEHGLNKGFIHYEDFVPSVEEFIISSALARPIVTNQTVRRIVGKYDYITRKNAQDIVQDFLDWIPNRSNHPFFVFLNFFDAHEPYFPPAPFNDKFGNVDARKNYLLQQEKRRGLRQDWQEMTKEEIQSEINSYDGAIAYLDQTINQLLARLKEDGILQNTLIVITADHGEQFGEHGLFVHGNSLYEPLLHVPLLLWFPALIPSSTRIHKPVSLRDLPATVVDLVGLDNDALFPGSSLARYWKNSPDSASLNKSEIFSEVKKAGWGKDWYPTSKGDMKSLIKDGFHYIWNASGREELYDLRGDPSEKRNLIAEYEGTRQLADFRLLLTEISPN